MRPAVLLACLQSLSVGSVAVRASEWNSRPSNVTASEILADTRTLLESGTWSPSCT